MLLRKFLKTKSQKTRADKRKEPNMATQLRVTANLVNFLTIKEFMTKSGQTIFKPALAKDIFSQKDFIK